MPYFSSDNISLSYKFIFVFYVLIHICISWFFYYCDDVTNATNRRKGLLELTAVEGDSLSRQGSCRCGGWK